MSFFGMFCTQAISSLCACVWLDTFSCCGSIWSEKGLRVSGSLNSCRPVIAFDPTWCCHIFSHLSIYWLWLGSCRYTVKFGVVLALLKLNELKAPGLSRLIVNYLFFQILNECQEGFNWRYLNVTGNQFCLHSFRHWNILHSDNKKKQNMFSSLICCGRTYLWPNKNLLYLVL